MADEKLQAEKAAAIEENITTKRGRPPKVKAAPKPSVPVVEPDPAAVDDVDLDVGLSKVELQQIAEEERVRLRKTKRETIKAQARAKIRKRLEQQAGIQEDEEEIYIDLAKHANYIMINGCQYLNGRWYRVPASLAQVFREVMQNGHYHQAEVDGKGKRYYTQRNSRLSPYGSSVVNTRSLLEV